jgi:hypothetical protein
VMSKVQESLFSLPMLQSDRARHVQKPLKLKFPWDRLFGVTNPWYAYNAHEKYHSDEEEQADER